ncbi:aminotransferase class III-fold pyridoxal phosphate-dependent enzyme [Cupriavidus basilensis]
MSKAIVISTSRPALPCSIPITVTRAWSQAMQAQMERFTHTAYQIVPYASYIELAGKINARAPGAFAKKTAFFTTGAEAVENAIKIARAAARAPRRDRLRGAASTGAP